MKIERKTDHIKVLEADLSDRMFKDYGIKCSGCKERYQMKRKEGDNNNLYCQNCGTKTPIRIIKHTRGLAAPNIQQNPNEIAIVQSKEPNFRGRDRMPKGINSGKKDPLVESLIEKGFTVIDSQTIEEQNP